MSKLGNQSKWKHWTAFALCGIAATATDIGIFSILLSLFKWDPLIARPPAIAAAIVIGWNTHRRFTFRIRSERTISEFVRYASVAWTSSAANYIVFVALLAFAPSTEPTILILISSALAMVVSYLGMRFGVFREHN